MRRLGHEEQSTRTRTRSLADPGAGPKHPLERFQQTIGNRAVCSQLMLHAPDGPMEQEAHRVAAAVTEGTTDHAGLDVSRGTPGLARVAAADGAREMSRGLALGDEWGARLAARRGAGRSLEAPTRAKLEVGFGVGLGALRVHSDGVAAGLCRDLRADAFTHGGDIYFAEGRYAPETTRGASLLAHEVTHTIQQRGLTRDGRGTAVAGSGGGVRSSAVQGLVSRADFVSLAGSNSAWGWTKGSTYDQLLVAITAYHAAQSDKARKLALARVVKLGNDWQKLHAGAPKAGDTRRAYYISGLIAEAEAEAAGRPVRGDVAPTTRIETRTRAGDAVADQAVAAVKDPKRSYKFTVRALIEHPLYGRFAARRARLVADNMFKLGRYKKTSAELKAEAARETVLADQPELADDKKRRELREASERVSAAGVGHTWIALVQRGEDGGAVDRKSFGLYPAIPLGQAPMEERPGDIKHPDHHDAIGGNIREREWDVGFTRYKAGLATLGRMMRSPPDYTLTGYNCTYFAKVVGAAVGVQIPDAYFTLPNLTNLWNPNTLHDRLA